MKKELGIGILLVVLCIVVGIINPHFFSGANLHNTSKQIGMYGIFSIGLGLVIITGGIDLSVGAIFALQGVVLAMLLRTTNGAPNWPWPIAVLATILGVMGLGALNGTFITKFRMQPFIVTLCGLMFYRGVTRFISRDETKGFGTGGFEFLRHVTTGGIKGVPAQFILLMIVSAIMFVVLHKSVFGRYLYAVGRNEDAARYSGIDTQGVILGAYVVESFLVAISGILFALDTNSISPSSHGIGFELYGIAAAVLGGCSLRGGEGSILGIVIGAALLQVLRNLVILLGIPSSLELAVVGAVIFIGVLVDQVLGQRKKRPAAVEVPAPKQAAGTA